MMQKRTCNRLGLALMVLVTGLLPACGGGGRESAEKTVDLEQLDPTGQSVVFWYQHTRQREDALKEMVARFNADNDYGITVGGEYAGNYGAIYNKMFVALQGGTLPDLVVAYQNQALEYWRAGGLVDMQAYMTSPRWGLTTAERSDFVAAFMRQDQLHSGVQTGIPPNRSIEVLYYNQDWLRELGAAGPPQTWDAFAQLCRAARDQPFSGNENKTRSVGFILDADASRLASMVFSRGGQLMNAEGTRYLLDTPEASASLALMKTLTEEGAVELMGEADGDQSAFAVGQCLFTLASTSGLSYVQDAVVSGSGFDWHVAPPPRTVPDPVVNFYGASISMGRTTPERQLAAWLFLKWFTEPSQQARWVEASNYFPARKSTKDALADYFAANPRYRQAYDLLEYGMAEPAVAGYEAVRRMISQTVVKVIQGGDVSTNLKRLQREANATMESD